MYIITSSTHLMFYVHCLFQSIRTNRDYTRSCLQRTTVYSDRCLFIKINDCNVKQVQLQQVSFVCFIRCKHCTCVHLRFRIQLNSDNCQQFIYKQHVQWKKTRRHDTTTCGILHPILVMIKFFGNINKLCFVVVVCQSIDKANVLSHIAIVHIFLKDKPTQ